MEKNCIKCNRILDCLCFYKSPDHKDGFGSWCKNCIKEYNKLPERKIVAKEYRNRPDVKDNRHRSFRKWYDKNIEQIKARTYENRLLAHYNMTLHDYNELLEQQNECCKICDVHISTAGKRGLVVDHDHQTNRVRGLLCNTCNILVGMAKDNIKILNNAIFYLKENDFTVEKK